MFTKKSIQNKALLIFAVTLAIVALAYTALAEAAEEVVINENINKAAGSLEISRFTTVNGNVTLNLGELTVLGVINGDVNSNMGQVNIAGDVNGNVEANMGEVIISGNVGGDVKARMGEVVVDGSIGGDLIADLGSTTVNGTIGGDVESGFGELRINGAIAGDVKSKGGNVFIAGIVEGNVILEQGIIELGPQAVVSGRVYVGRGVVKKAESAIVGSLEIGEELTISEIQEGESVSGYRFEGIDGDFVGGIVEEVTGSIDRAFRDRGFMPHMQRTGGWFFTPMPFNGIYGYLARNVINMLIMFALAVLTLTLFPAQVRSVGDAVVKQAGPVIGWGLLAAFLAIPLMVMLAITIIGIPLIIVEIILLTAAAVLGYAGIVKLLGSRIVSAASSTATVNPFVATAIGVLVIGLIRLIPFAGWLVSLVVFILAVGASLVTRFGTKQPVVTAELPQSAAEGSSNSQ